jgi:hypothetical protein
MISGHPNMLPILEKWSSKIQAATTQVAAKGSKFLQSTKTGQDGIMEAISAGLENRVSFTYSFLPDMQGLMEIERECQTPHRIRRNRLQIPPPRSHRIQIRSSTLRPLTPPSRKEEKERSRERRFKRSKVAIYRSRKGSKFRCSHPT